MKRQEFAYIYFFSIISTSKWNFCISNIVHFLMNLVDVKFNFTLPTKHIFFRLVWEIDNLHPVYFLMMACSSKPSNIATNSHSGWGRRGGGGGGGGGGGEKNAHFGRTACKIRYDSLCVKFGTWKVRRLNQSRSIKSLQRRNSRPA